jgi:VWFA-related protein
MTARVTSSRLSATLVFVAATGLFFLSGAQAPQEPVFRATVSLVQVDAIVTDGRGRQVTDLNAADFEILQDGKPQKITGFSYVRVAEPAPVPGRKAQQPRVPIPAPPTVLRPEQARRSYALVVDDLALGFESIARIRLALKEFVDEQVQPGDLVAILRTSAGLGALQQFTSDKRLLYAAIERLHWSAFSRVGSSSFGSSDPGSPASMEELQQRMYTAGTLAAVKFVLDGLEQVPGRKALVLFSERIQVILESTVDMYINESLERLSDQANRAGVLIYTVDPRGLTVEPPKRAWQAGLNYLAQSTGGLFLRENNDIGGMVREALDDLQGYYLLAYAPDTSSYEASTGRRLFHSLSVRTKRPGLHVRSRAGFYGGEEPKRPAKPSTPRQQLAAALTSPFNAGDIGLRMTALFYNDADLGSYVVSMLHIDTKDLLYTPTPSGDLQAVLDSIAITFGDNGETIGQSDMTMTFKAMPEKMETVRAEGVTLNLKHRVKKPGGYQMRVAVRDVATGRIGTANQFVDVPDVGKNRLLLSGVLLQEKREIAGRPVDSLRTSAQRVFQPGAELTYGYQVVNPRPSSRGDRRPQVETQVVLYRDGREIFAGTPALLDTKGQTDLKRLVAGGALRLGDLMKPGDYILQVVATDKLANSKNATAAQWTDFQVAP